MRYPAYRTAPARASTFAEFFRFCSSYLLTCARNRRINAASASCLGAIGARLDLDSPHSVLYLGTDQINMEKPIIQPRAAHLDALGQDKGSLELSGGDSTVQIHAPRIVRLLAAHDELVVLNRNAEITHGEAGYREGDLQGILAELFDIVRRISIARSLADPIESPFEMIEPQEQGRVEHRQSWHCFSS